MDISSREGGEILEGAFIIIPIIVIVAFCVILGLGITQYIKNENSPIVATKAKLIDKKCDTTTSTDANGAVTVNETLYLTFELDTGSAMKYVVGGRIYRSVPLNEWGTLTFQGTRFLSFESASVVVKK